MNRTITVICLGIGTALYERSSMVRSFGLCLMVLGLAVIGWSIEDAIRHPTHGVPSRG